MKITAKEIDDPSIIQVIDDKQSFINFKPEIFLKCLARIEIDVPDLYDRAMHSGFSKVSNGSLGLYLSKDFGYYIDNENNLLFDSVLEYTASRINAIRKELKSFSFSHIEEQLIKRIRKRIYKDDFEPECKKDIKKLYRYLERIANQLFISLFAIVLSSEPLVKIKSVTSKTLAFTPSFYSSPKPYIENKFSSFTKEFLFGFGKGNYA